MRISDWSSDVCSSDLARPIGGGARRIGDRSAGIGRGGRLRGKRAGRGRKQDGKGKRADHGGDSLWLRRALIALRRAPRALICTSRSSEERRVGTECVSTCSTRCLAYPSKKKQK